MEPINKKIIKEFIYIDKYIDRTFIYPSCLFWEKDVNESIIMTSWKKLISKMKSGKINNHGIGLYIHIPFCVTICNYCNINGKKIPSNILEIQEYLKNIDKECEKFSNLFSGITIETVYIGGGTPSILSEKILNYYLE